MPAIEAIRSEIEKPVLRLTGLATSDEGTLDHSEPASIGPKDVGLHTIVAIRPIEPNEGDEIPSAVDVPHRGLGQRRLRTAPYRMLAIDGVRAARLTENRIENARSIRERERSRERRVDRERGRRMKGRRDRERRSQNERS